MATDAENIRPPAGTIAFFLPSLGGGGAEMHCLRVANSDVWAPYAPSILVARPGGRYEQNLRAGVGLQSLLAPWVKSSRLSMIMSVLPLRRWLRRHQPKLVISFLNHTSVVLDLALGRERRGTKVVLCLQNNFSVERAEWTGLGGRWFGRRVAQALQRADAIVALSEGVRRDFLSVYPSLAAKTEVIFNAGYDDNVITRAREPEVLPRAARFRLVACGRLTEQKDYPLLLNAMAWLVERRDCELVILGEGHLRVELERRARELGLGGRVRFLGFDPNPHRFMASADAFVLSSAWEGFGNVLVEAMALGVPVVSMDCPYGPSEIIRDGQSGLLVTKRTAEALGGALLQVVNEPVLAKALAAGGQLRAADFHASMVARNYRKLCDRLLAVTP